MNENKDEQKKLTEILGEALLVLINTKTHRNTFFVSDLEWLLLTPISKGQFRLYKDDKGIPTGLVLWAYVNKEVDQRLEQGIGKLGLNDWDSGDILWIVDIVAPYGDFQKMFNETHTTALKGKRIKYQSIDAEGNRKIYTTAKS